MRIFIIALLLAISYAQTECKNFGREVNGVCECTPNYTGETCETRRTYEGWQWHVLYTPGETCADRGYFPIGESNECYIASRELYNWNINRMAMTKFDEEGFPGCWTVPGVGSLDLGTTFLEAAVDMNKWDMTKKLVCKHLLNEEAPPQIKSRLVDATTGQPSQDNKGLLQVWDLHWNYWCDAGKTSKQGLDAVANLACMEMGYAGVAYIRGNQWTFNKWKDLVDEIFISNFDCLGAETSLSQCGYQKGMLDTDCMANQAIEVTCSSEALTLDPTAAPTTVPTAAPTIVPTVAPTIDPTMAPTIDPTSNPTAHPTTAMKPTESTAPIVDTGNCAWESNWWWGGNNYCSCRGGYVKIGRWGYWSEWQRVEGSGVRCEADKLGNPLWGVTKECRCGQRGGKIKAGYGRRMLKMLSEA